LQSARANYKIAIRRRDIYNILILKIFLFKKAVLTNAEEEFNEGKHGGHIRGKLPGYGTVTQARRKSRKLNHQYGPLPGYTAKRSCWCVFTNHGGRKGWRG
jgi:hypothetical protein